MTLSTKLLILLIAVGVLFFGGYFLGKSDEREDAQLRQLHAVERAIDQAADIASQDAEVSAGQEQTRERIRTVYRTITQEVENNVAENPAYLRCGLDAVGLCWWNAANQGDSLDSAGQCDARVSGLAAGEGWPLGQLVPQSQGRGGAVPGMPGAQPGQGRGDPQP
jgi:hypothetical protein